METKLWVVDKNDLNGSSYPHVKEAALLLRNNEVVAFPTETVYGLGANATSDTAVNKIFEAKGRPSDNPLIVHISNRKQLDDIAHEIPEIVDTLIEHFWPGPLTLVLRKKATYISERVTAGLETVAVRMPDHLVALAILEEAEIPVAAPSANLSGRPSPTTAGHVLNDLNGRISGIVDGGSTGVGLESTVLDCTEEIPVILRPGGITKEQLEIVCGQVSVDEALLKEGQAPKSPGMKYKHYSPKAPVTIIEGSQQFIQEVIKKKQSEGFKVGVLTTQEREGLYNADKVVICGSRTNLKKVATGLYDALRAFDESDIDYIFSESFPQEGIGVAIMNRLLKAASFQVIRET